MELKKYIVLILIMSVMIVSCSKTQQCPEVHIEPSVIESINEINITIPENELKIQNQKMDLLIQEMKNRNNLEREWLDYSYNDDKCSNICIKESVGGYMFYDGSTKVCTCWNGMMQLEYSETFK